MQCSFVSLPLGKVDVHGDQSLTTLSNEYVSVIDGGFRRLGDDRDTHGPCELRLTMLVRAEDRVHNQEHPDKDCSERDDLEELLVHRS